MTQKQTMNKINLIKIQAMFLNYKIVLTILLISLTFSGICQTFHSSSYNVYPFRFPINLDGEYKKHEIQTKIQIQTIREDDIYIMGGVAGEWKISINDSAFCKIYMKLDSDTYGNPYYWDGYGYYTQYVIDSNCKHIYRPEITKFKNALLIVDVEKQSIILYNDLK